jgi:hypothetical protein
MMPGQSNGEFFSFQPNINQPSVPVKESRMPLSGMESVINIENNINPESRKLLSSPRSNWSPANFFKLSFKTTMVVFQESPLE